MKELKKLTSFQDKVALGAKPKGFSEPWAVKVSNSDLIMMMLAPKMAERRLVNTKCKVRRIS